MNYQRTDRIRRAAILVASLEEPLAEALLRQLPDDEVARIYNELEQLDEVDPEEQRDVLEEFRRTTTRQESVGGVEFTLSPRSEAKTSIKSKSEAATTPAGPLGSVDHAALAKLLAEEHPQTAAVVIARLGEAAGAGVFAALPEELQSDVLERIVNLQDVDNTAAEELETHLVRRLSEVEDRRRRKAAGTELAMKLAVSSAPEVRATLLARLATHEAATRPNGMTSRANAAAKVRQRAEDLLDAFRSRPSVGEVDESAVEDAEANLFHRAQVQAAYGGNKRTWGESPLLGEVDLPDDCSRELESLGDRTLLEAIGCAEEQTVLRALAASSDRLVKRVVRRLPRKHGRQLKTLLHSQGPTTLVELRVAQRQLLAIAQELNSAAA